MRGAGRTSLRPNRSVARSLRLSAELRVGAIRKADWFQVAARKGVAQEAFGELLAGFCVAHDVRKMHAARFDVDLIVSAYVSRLQIALKSRANAESGSAADQSAPS